MFPGRASGPPMGSYRPHRTRMIPPTSDRTPTGRSEPLRNGAMTVVEVRRRTTRSQGPTISTTAPINRANSSG